MAAAGSTRRPRSHRGLVCKVRPSPGPSEAGIQPGLGHSSRHTTAIFVPRGDSMNEQNFSNHAKFVPMFHLFVIPVLIINVVIRCYSFIKWLPATPAGMFAGVFGILLSIALLVMAFLARLFALGVQDRVIRLEERLRY